MISNSPLTISRSNVRGFYLRQGPWQVNAGYSFFSTFENLLLPTNKEGVVGVAYRYQLSPRSSLTPNLFVFELGQPQPGRSGPVGTLFYEAQPATGVKFSAELGVSRSLGGAVEMEVDRPNRRAWAKLRVAPPELPSLTTDQQSGRQFEGGGIWQGDKTALNANISSRRYVQGTLGHTTSVASLDARRQLTEQWAVHGGSGVSLFENASQSASRVQSLTLPLGTSFFRQNVGLDIDYQFARERPREISAAISSGRTVPARHAAFIFLYLASVRRRLRRRDRFSQTCPGCSRCSIDSALPRRPHNNSRTCSFTNAELSAYGYANRIQIDVTPIRTRVGASGGWSGSGSRRPQLFVSTLFNRDESIDRASLGAIHSVSYSQRLDRGTELFFTWSALCQDRFFSSSTCRPVVFASLRRSLSNGPGLLVSHRDHIDGIVFKDDRAQGLYTPGLPPLEGVDVILDNVVHARTDSSGRFRFDDVTFGRHRVEAHYVSEQPTFFTTPSPADVDAGASVNFGIALARSSLRGVVRTDAGLGLSGVLIHVANADRRTTARTEDDGSFIAEGLAAGVYDVAIDAGSVPAGYPLDNLSAQRVRVEQTAPGRVTFVLRVYRTVTGRAQLFNRETGQYTALGGAVVELSHSNERPSRTPTASMRFATSGRASTPSSRGATDAGVPRKGERARGADVLEERRPVGVARRHRSRPR